MSADFLSKDIVYINSKARIDGRSDDFTIDFTKQVNIPNKYTYASLLNFACPKSYYLFNSSNNTFQLTESKTNYTVTITVGNYNTATLLTELISAISSSGAMWTYAVTISQRTGKITFTVSGNGGVQPIFNFTNSNGCDEILGFENASYTFAGNSLTSPGVISLQLTQTIQLMSNIVKNNTLASIVPNSADFGYVLYNEQNPAFVSHELILKNITSAKFWLLDGNTGNHIDLNGQEFSFTFVMFEKNDYYEYLKFDKKMERIIEDISNNKID